jgi:hypothetical protein
MDSEELSLRNLQMSYGALRLELPHLLVNLPNTRATAEARLRGTAISRDIDVTFSAGADFKAVDSWFAIAEVQEAFNGIISVDHIRLDTLETSDPFTVNFSRTPSGVTLSGGPKNMIRMSLSDEGAFYAGLSAPSPIRGSAIGTISSKTIDAQVSDLYIDLVSLWRFIPSNKVIACTGGFVNASVQIRGPLGDPEFFGVAQGRSVRLTVPDYVSAEIGPTPITAVLDGNEMRFGPLITPVGTGLGQVSGEFRFDRWIPSTYNLDIRAMPDTPVPFAVDIRGVAAHGGASGTLIIARIDRITRITGNLTGEDTEITLGTERFSPGERQAANSSDKPVIVDISLKTGRKVEFLYPNAQLPLLRANASAGSGVRITSDSMAARYTVDGDVSLKNGEVFYFQRSFYIRNGTLSFDEDEIQFEPLLTVRAEIRDRIDDGPVTISMIVDNAPLMSFTPRFEASPALSQVEIFSLLGQNLTGAAAEDGSVSLLNTILASSTDAFSQFLPVRWAERELRNLFRLDMFSFRTQLLTNVFSQIWNPVDTIGTLRNYFDNTSVFIGKYVSPDMFVQAMILYRYDNFLNPQGG